MNDRIIWIILLVLWLICFMIFAQALININVISPNNQFVIAIMGFVCGIILLEMYYSIK